MKCERFIKEYLVFNKNERRGLVVLLGLIVIIYLLPYLFAKPALPAIKPGTALAADIDSFAAVTPQNATIATGGGSYAFENTEEKSFTPGKLFAFDPNTTTLEQWQAMGLSERLSKTIVKYRTKGGHFYKPEDLKKIWGLPEAFYERVKSYIKLPVTAYSRQEGFFEPKPKKREKSAATVFINQADTTAFIALPGIGSKLAARIIAFREKLGGFYSVGQVGETYGLPDSTFQKIKAWLQVDANHIRKLNVNTATKDALKAHPYIRWNLANAIVEYRNQHGAFKNLEELRNIVLIDEATFNKIIHYLDL